MTGQLPELGAMAVFVKVVELRSFRGAGKALALPKTTVSRRIAELEERLGVRLLQRTTRTLGLTDAGRVYHERCVRILGDVEDAERAVSSLQEAPRGLLRVTVPLGFRYLAPIATEFLALHPEVRLEIVHTDRVVDLVEDGFDLGIRFGRLADSTLVARSLGAGRRVLVASPRYLRARGVPEEPEDLAGHDCLVFGGGSERARWTLERGGRRVEIDVRARLLVNDFEALHEAALGGIGIAMLPAYACAEDLRARRLRAVLPGYGSPEAHGHVVYPSARHLAPKVRAFLDHLLARWSPPPWERERSGGTASKVDGRRRRA